MKPRTNPKNPETDPRALLGEQLRLARIAAGFRSHDQLAAAIGCDRSVITKAESGERPPTWDVLTRVLDACNVTGQLRLFFEGAWKVARAKDGPVPMVVLGWIDAEGKAHTLLFWAPLVVPGLVQTTDYARAIFEAAGMDKDTISERLQVRMSRQSILERPDPPNVTIVLWEPVLHHMIGSSEIMRGQLTRLVDLSVRPNLMVHVLPTKIGANAGLSGAIDLASGDGTPEVLASDSIVEDHLTADPILVRKASARFNLLRADAQPRAESRATIMEATKTCND